jgi:hypothetical protein
LQQQQQRPQKRLRPAEEARPPERGPGSASGAVASPAPQPNPPDRHTDLRWPNPTEAARSPSSPAGRGDRQPAEGLARQNPADRQTDPRAPPSPLPPREPSQAAAPSSRLAAAVAAGGAEAPAGQGPTEEELLLAPLLALRMHREGVSDRSGAVIAALEVCLPVCLPACQPGCYIVDTVVFDGGAVVLTLAVQVNPSRACQCASAMQCNTVGKGFQRRSNAFPAALSSRAHCCRRRGFLAAVASLRASSSGAHSRSRRSRWQCGCRPGWRSMSRTD